MQRIRIAFATDDGVAFMSRHFGDAKYFDIHDVDQSGAMFVRRISNTVEDEDASIHADPVKAGGIMGLLVNEGVTVAASPVFGPNIKRIKRKFVCVLMNDATIAEAAARLVEHFELILGEWGKGEERGTLNLLQPATTMRQS